MRYADLHRVTRESIEHFADLHRVTRGSIEHQGVHNVVGVYPCGCHRANDDRIRLCEYHDGMDTGLDLADVPIIPAPGAAGTTIPPHEEGR